METNPIMKKSELEYNALPLDKIKNEHYIPAIKDSLANAKNKIDIITSNKLKPDFENTLVELEKTIEELDRVLRIYSVLFITESDDDFKNLDVDISPLKADFFSKLFTNEILFQKVNNVYNNRDSFKLDSHDKRLLDYYYNKFIRNGALLNESEKKKIQEFDNQLSTLGGRYSKNILNEKNTFQLHITDVSKLEGIPQNVLAIAEETARGNENKKGWVFTLNPTIAFPVCKYAKNREIRKIINDALHRGNVEGENDNRDLILKIIKLKKERAQLLGFDTASHYVISDTMAKNPLDVMTFLEELKKTALPIAKEEEVEELKEFAKEFDGLDCFECYDWSYYSEKLKKVKYSFNDEVLRPYFKLENVLDGFFQFSYNLFDVTFEEIHDVPVYHNDVKTYKVIDKRRGLIGLFYLDLFPRETKHNGAWADSFRT